MGARRDFRCPACGYEPLDSGGPDMGMSCTTQTVLCRQCQVVGDVVTEQGRREEFPPRGPLRNDALLQCPADASHEVETWS